MTRPPVTREIRLGYNAVPDNALGLIKDVFAAGQFSPGKKVREFEIAFAARHGAKHAIFVNSGTDALRLSLLALKAKFGWLDGDLVAVPTLTFVATVNVILQAGLVPWFVDVSIQDYTINVHSMRRKLFPHPPARLRAVMPVHLFGHSCSSEIFNLARELKLKILEDSCETILNPIRGNASCYSTYMAHHVTTGVGGLAVTNDPELNELIRSFANHGRNVSYLPGYRAVKDIRRRFQFDRVGYSSRATEFEAALGLSQLPGLENHVLKRRENAKAMAFLLGRNCPGIITPQIGPDHTCMMLPLVISEASPIQRAPLCRFLEKHGIETRDMMPITSQPCYKGLVNPDHFSVSRWINKKGFYIACHPGMMSDDVAYVVDIFGRYFNVSRKPERISRTPGRFEVVQPDGVGVSPNARVAGRRRRNAKQAIAA